MKIREAENGGFHGVSVLQKGHVKVIPCPKAVVVKDTEAVKLENKLAITPCHSTNCMTTIGRFAHIKKPMFKVHLRSATFRVKSGIKGTRRRQIQTKADGGES